MLLNVKVGVAAAAVPARRPSARQDHAMDVAPTVSLAPIASHAQTALAMGESELLYCYADYLW